MSTLLQQIRRETVSVVIGRLRLCQFFINYFIFSLIKNLFDIALKRKIYLMNAWRYLIIRGTKKNTKKSSCF
jgi:hypothetical protein